MCAPTCRREEDVRGLVDRTVARFGRLDVAVNNAGTEGQPGPVTGADRRELCRHVRHQRPRHAAVPEARAARDAAAAARQHRQRVVRRRPRGFAGASVYVASKHAVEGLTKSAALEAAESGVRVNIVAPGPIETGMLDRFTGTEERKAGLVSRVPLKRAGRTRGGRRGHRVRRIRQGVVHHGRVHPRRRRHDGAIRDRARGHARSTSRTSLPAAGCAVMMALPRSSTAARTQENRDEGPPAPSSPRRHRLPAGDRGTPGAGRPG